MGKFSPSCCECIALPLKDIALVRSRFIIIVRFVRKGLYVAFESARVYRFHGLLIA